MRLITDAALAAVTIWQEARGEPMAGKIAVGEVIRNRMRRTGKTVVEVVLQPYQFSGFNTRDPNRVPSFLIDDTDPVVMECARAWYLSEDTHLTLGSEYYVNLDVAEPTWAAQFVKMVKIGHHTFFRDQQTKEV